MSFIKEYKWIIFFVILVDILIYYYVFHLQGPCNTYPGFGFDPAYFHQRCKCLGKLEGSLPTRYLVDPATVKKRCKGIILYEYRVFQVSWPHINKQVGNKPILTRRQALNACNLAVNSFSHYVKTREVTQEFVDTFRRQCENRAKMIFLF